MYRNNISKQFKEEQKQFCEKQDQIVMPYSADTR